jgi:hypothetical protein
MREIDLARKVIAWLIDQKWDVYQEVQVFQGGSIADIVARQASVCWVIETKMTLSLAVIGQAHEWLHWANYVSVAVPAGKRGMGFAAHILNTYGIGLLKVNQYEYDWSSPVEEMKHPAFRRKTGRHLLGALNEGHKTYAEAGNNQGRHWSSFKQTGLDIYRYVRVNEGCTLKDVLKNVKHHYATPATARSCIPRWAEAGKIDRIRVLKEKGQWRFYTTEGKNEFTGPEDKRL